VKLDILVNIQVVLYIGYYNIELDYIIDKFNCKQIENEGQERRGDEGNVKINC